MSKRKKIGSDRAYTALAALLVAVFLFVGYNFGIQYLRYLDLNDELAGYQHQLGSLEAEYDELCEQKDLLHTDTYIEYIARRNLGMVMQGEKLVQQYVESDAPTMDKNFRKSDYNH